MKSLAPQTDELKLDKKRNYIKLLAVILAALLVLSASGLAVRWIYLTQFAAARGTATVPDNLISETEGIPEMPSEVEAAQPDTPEQTASDSAPETGSHQISAGQNAVGRQSEAQASGQEAALLELYRGRPEVNEPFAVDNMLPGDSVTRYFCIHASHDTDLHLIFQPEITDQTQGLADVLHIKVTRLDTGEVLCDGAFSLADQQEFVTVLPRNGQGESTIYYRIDVSADTSIGNEYQLASLTADFHWYVNGGDQGALTPPKTGDTAMPAIMWTVLCLSASALVVLLLIRRKGAKDCDHT